MKNITPKKNIILLNYEEEKLLKKYIEEYNELYQKILLLSPNDFIQNLSKRVEIVLKEKINGFSASNKSKVENFILDKVYSNDYKFSLFAKRSILQRNLDEKNNHIFSSEIIPHCINDKKDGYYIHTCGNKFQIFKYKNNNNFENFYFAKNPTTENNDKIYLLYCEECDMIYKSNLIKFRCFYTNEDFYSKAIDTSKNTNYHLATWKKYHCNIIINDVMKCQKCHENLYYFPDVNHLFCKKCNHEFEPCLYKWKCIKCKKDFTAEVKIFNPLEYKNMKICIKEAILSKKRARPDYLGCGCEIKSDPKKLKFFHKNGCTGDLFFGELNGKKIVVCNKCESMGLFDGYVWTCPLCNKRFKNDINYYLNENINNIDIKNNNISINDNINNENKNLNTSNKYLNYSNSNWNIKNNITSLYKSPIKFKNNIPKNNFNKNMNNNKCKSDIKNIGHFRRNYSAIKLIDDIKTDFGLCLSPKPKMTKNIDINPINNNINNTNNNDNFNNIKKVIVPKNNIINYSPYQIHSKFESKIVYNQLQINSGNKRSASNNRLMSNLDLSDNYYNNLKTNLFGTKNNNSNAYYQPYIKNINNNMENNIKKRAHSNFNSINVNIDEGIYSKNIINNNKIINTIKIPVSNINNNKIKINSSGYESTSGDSQGEKSPKDNNRNIIINQSPNPIQNKKVIPGQLNLMNYIIKKQIGQGSYGQIFLVEDINSNQFALKKILAFTENSIKKIKKELKILLEIQNTLSDLNVVSIYGITSQQLDITTYALYVLMELAVSDWEKEILERKKNNNYYSEYELMTILHSLVKSLSILQQKNISHRDIKPQNILILKDKNTGQQKYKLADFGEAKELLKENPTDRQTLRGTELYMSPILFYALRAHKKMKYVQHNSYKSDVFSFGLCSLFAATLGFKSLYDVRELKSNISVFVVVEKYLRFKYSDSVVNIIAKMLDINENSRCDFIMLEKEFNNLGYY